MPDSRVPPAPTRMLAVPGPIAALFNRVPLAVYPPNDLPLRSPSSDTHRDTPILYVFTTSNGARTGAPSFNPSCLKWQVCSSPTSFFFSPLSTMVQGPS